VLLLAPPLIALPAAAYAGMDFASRDRYRHVVEAIAKTSRLVEELVAGSAIDLARASRIARPADRGEASAPRFVAGRRGCAAPGLAAPAARSYSAFCQ
jgi:hypothetical protein